MQYSICRTKNTNYFFSNIPYEIIMNNRIVWVDWIKVIGIYIIVLGHFPLENSWLKPFIFSFHVPVFFIISGYLYKSCVTLSSSWKKNIQTLLVPYLCISFIIIFYNFLRFYSHHSSGFQESIIFLIKQTSAILLGLNNNSWKSLEGVGGPIWYIYVLFFIRLLFDKMRHRNAHTIVCILFLITNYFLCSFNINYPFSILNIFLSYPFFTIGYNIRNHHFKTFEKSRIFLTKHPIINFCFIIISGFITYYISYYFNGIAYMYNHAFGNNLLLFYISALFGSICIFALCQYVSSFRVNMIEILSNGTVLIVGLHIILINYSNYIIDLTSILQSILLALVYTLLFYYPIIITSKLCPWVLGKKTKKSTA